MWDAFAGEYLPEDAPVQLLACETTSDESERHGDRPAARGRRARTVMGQGGGPVAAFVGGLQADLGIDVDVVDYSEHAVGAGSDAMAAAYVETQRPDGTIKWGVGVDESILIASLRAVISAVNRHRADTHVVERHAP